jgi:hypothetical protein
VGLLEQIISPRLMMMDGGMMMMTTGPSMMAIFLVIQAIICEILLLIFGLL